jgi:hypothetical protein
LILLRVEKALISAGKSIAFCGSIEKVVCFYHCAFFRHGFGLFSSIHRYSLPGVLEATERDANKLLMRTLTFQTLVMLLPLFVMLFTGQLSQPRVLITVLVFWALLLAFAIQRIIRRVRKLTRAAASTYELTIDDHQIMRVQHDCPTLTIPRDAIRKIAERAGQGFRIETADPALNIWVPRELEGYDEVKMLLLTSSPVETSTMQHPVAITYATMIASLIAFFVVMGTHNRIVVTLLGAALLAVIGWYFAYVVRVSANLSRSVKRSTWVVGLPALALIARIVSVWR